ncbi:low-density lipoprotein receptor-related protein 4-like isoform X1 [Nasonia vitripennis]|uniref:Uncharacterized protein n=1 Tax=Nasonia vitripennis TaxID=7425 RepID=A0A7M7T6H5_NASVI|nr:low-density lipoprotein receptor-related protein 4-like isoform X1 [Nasonia vitripennis]
MYSIVKSKPNPCAKNNGGCEQLCLLSNSTSEGYSCACELGQKLKEDQKSCVGATDQGFLMYLQGDFIHGRVIDRLGIKDNDEPRFGEVIYPVFTPSFTVEKAKVRHFAHDVRERAVYFADDIAVWRVSLVDFRNSYYGYRISIANYA